MVLGSPNSREWSLLSQRRQLPRLSVDFPDPWGWGRIELRRCLQSHGRALACSYLPASQLPYLPPPASPAPLTAASLAVFIFPIWGQKALKGSGVFPWGFGPQPSTPIPPAFNADEAVGAAGLRAHYGNSFPPRACLPVLYRPGAQSVSCMTVWALERPRSLSL